MITENAGADIFECGADLIVIPVNCIGVMGKGLARECWKKFPKLSREYRKACNNPFTGLRPGGVLIKWDGTKMPGIAFMATKDHWKQPSQMEWIIWGLENLRQYLIDQEGRGTVGRVAIPAVGCGYGGLDWREVREWVKSKMFGLPFDILTIPPR